MLRLGMSNRTKVSALGGAGDKVFSRVKVCRVCGANGVNYAEAALTCERFRIDRRRPAVTARTVEYQSVAAARWIDVT